MVRFMSILSWIERMRAGAIEMGRFHRKIRILAKTEWPVFVRMHETDNPIPVDPRSFYPWALAQPKPERYRLFAVFREFVMSERYSRTVMAEGAYYHSLDGVVTRPVPDVSIKNARRNIENIDQFRASRPLGGSHG